MTKRSALLLASAVALLAATVSASACSRPDVPAEPPSIRGVVTTIQPAEQGGSMRVVWTDDPAVGAEAEYDAAQITATGDTKVLRRDGEADPMPIDFSELRTGDVVEAWFAGPVAESYPVQTGASHIVVTGRYSGKLPEPPGLQPPQE